MNTFTGDSVNEMLVAKIVGKRLVLCSGCKMPTDAPGKNMRAMVKVARTY